MSARRVAAWAYVAQAAGFLGLIQLPILLRAFAPERVSLWYLLLTWMAFVQLGEQCLEPVIARYMTYARTGVREFPAYGALPVPGTGTADPGMMAALIGSARRLYAYLGVLNVLLFGVGGGWFLWRISSASGLNVETMRAWGLLVVAQFAGCRWAVNLPILQGAGRADQSYQASALQRAVFSAASLAGMALVPRLEVLGVAAFLGNMVGLGLGWFRVRNICNASIRVMDRSLDTRLVREILRGCSRLWVTRFGSMLILRSSFLLVSSMLGLSAASGLALSLQAGDIISQLSSAPLMASIPNLAELHARRAMTQLKAQVGHLLLSAWISFVALGLFLVLWGADLLQILDSRSALLPGSLLTLLLAAGFLEMNHSMSASLLMLGNRVPFLRAAILSGASILATVYVVLRFGGGGVCGAIGVPLVIQLLYNNWKWPCEMLRFFETSYWELIQCGLRWRPAKALLPGRQDPGGMK